MTVKILLSLIVSLIFFSCSKILMYKSGIRNPRFENFKTISSFMHRIDIDNDSSLYVYKSLRDFSNNKKLKLPGIYFFNSKGYFVNYITNSKECNKKVIPYIDSLDRINEQQFDTTFKLDYFLSKIIDVNHRTPKLCNNKNSYVIITFSKFIGKKINKEKISLWNERLKKENTQLFLVNHDFQKRWKDSIPNRLPKIY